MLISAGITTNESSSLLVHLAPWNTEQILESRYKPVQDIVRTPSGSVLSAIQQIRGHITADGEQFLDGVY